MKLTHRVNIFAGLHHSYNWLSGRKKKRHRDKKKTRLDILHGQALFRGEKQLLTRAVW